MNNLILEKYIIHLLNESIEKKYRINTILTKVSRMIVSKAQELLIHSKKLIVRFIISKNEIPELADFNELYLSVKYDFTYKSKAGGTGGYTEGVFDFPENKITIKVGIDKSVFKPEKIPILIMNIKSVIRHELEHVVQYHKKGFDIDTEIELDYFEKPHEIAAFAADLHRQFVHRKKRELTFDEALKLWIKSYEPYFSNDAEKNKFEKALRDYSLRRYPILKNQ